MDILVLYQDILALYILYILYIHCIYIFQINTLYYISNVIDVYIEYY